MRRGGAINAGPNSDPTVYFREQGTQGGSNATWGFRCAWFDPDDLTHINVDER